MTTNYHFRPRAPQKRESRHLSTPLHPTPPLAVWIFLGRLPLESDATTPEFFPPRGENLSLSLPPSLYLIPVPPPFPLSSAPSDDLLSPVFRLPFVVTDGWHGDVTVDARRDAWCPVFRISRVPAARLTIFRRRQHRNSRWILKRPRGNILGEKEGGGGGLGSTVIDGVTEWKTCRGSLNVFRDASFSSLFFFIPPLSPVRNFYANSRWDFRWKYFSDDIRWYFSILRRKEKRLFYSSNFVFPRFIESNILYYTETFKFSFRFFFVVPIPRAEVQSRFPAESTEIIKSISGSKRANWKNGFTGGWLSFFLLFLSFLSSFPSPPLSLFLIFRGKSRRYRANFYSASVKPASITAN